jgi:hypothetical protein
VRLAIVEVEVERPGRREHAAELPQARLEEAEVVVVAVLEGRLAQHARGVPAPAESGAVALGVRTGADRPAPLGPPGVERGIGIDELERLVVEAGQKLEVVAEQDEILAGPRHAPECRGATG